ncbi:MAG TPA: NAD(P)-dependent alcohol dehydrogenase [Nitrospirota bacterium]|nr:NAD(P)-dependent alcohol dehydrogenase [Nitrospirota bacterium]
MQTQTRCPGRAMMKAVVFSKYGGNEVVEVKDVLTPICGPEDVLIKVHGAGVNPVDWKVRSGHLKIITGSAFPKILGNECAGEIAETGKQVKKFKRGDAVIGWPSVRRLGAFAEYGCVSERAIFPKSKSISFEESACIPIAGLTALQALRDRGRIASGKRVLINGASGGVGHFAVQIAKIFGVEVTGVCSGANAEFVTGLGADRVIDYSTQDFTSGSERFDIIFDAVAKSAFGACKKALAPNGVYISTLPSAAIMLSQYVTGFFTGSRALTIMVKANEADLQWMADHVAAGRIRVVIDKAYPLAQAKEALAHSESGKVRGKIVLKVT